MQANQTCQRCGSSNLLTHEREFSNSTHHIELRCTAASNSWRNTITSECHSVATRENDKRICLTIIIAGYWSGQKSARAYVGRLSAYRHKGG
jgi:hypothetical protein